MNSGLYAALSGNLAAMKRLDVISNNLANVNTPGFKKDRMSFESLLMASTGAANGDQPVLAENSFYTDFSAGPVKQTGNTLDLALEGNGFFVVNTPQGQAYTRQGTFQRNSAGRLVNRDGYEVVGTGALTINGSKVEIDSKGGVQVDGAQQGTLQVVDFPKPYALQKIGDGLFVPANPQATPEAVANPVIRQGFLEESNVNVVREMAELIESNRFFETCQKIVKSYDDVSAKAANEIGKI
jgi:flagellar basal-body rod protein FlgF